METYIYLAIIFVLANFCAYFRAQNKKLEKKLSEYELDHEKCRFYGF